MKNFKSGTYINQDYYRSFQPNLINKQMLIDNMEVIQLLSQVDRELGRLDMYSKYIPNVDLYISMHVAKEATQNQATFKLLENDKFELHWTGVFFYDEFFVGTYQKNNDTLFLDYKRKKPVRFGDKIFMNNKDEILETGRKEEDSLVNVVPFYYGYCKGLN